MARYNFYGWAPYVSAAERKKQAAKEISSLQKKGKAVQPVQTQGRAIAKTFWGKAWCDNLEAYSDYSNRLPRGRTYVRNGSVIDLQIEKGEITALVSGSAIYEVSVEIRSLNDRHWKEVVSACSGQIDSLVELLQGRFSKGVMEIVTCPKRGLFPSPKQISMNCSCPDSAVMCKHVAAVLYGVGARLDESPELFFKLRGVDHTELIAAAGAASVVATAAPSEKILSSQNLSSIFGIEIDLAPADEEPAKPRSKTTKQKRASLRKKKRKKQDADR